MGIGQKKINRRSRVAGGRAVGRWMWGVAFAAGVLLSVIGQWLAHTALGSAEAERGSGESGSRERAEKRAPGPTGQPWGDLEITPLVLERPEEMFEQYPQSPVVRWYLPEDSF